MEGFLISMWSFILFGEDRAARIIMRDREKGEIREGPSST
jgi:hypothetical protein